MNISSARFILTHDELVVHVDVKNRQTVVASRNGHSRIDADDGSCCVHICTADIKNMVVNGTWNKMKSNGKESSIDMLTFRDPGIIMHNTLGIPYKVYCS